MNNALPKQHKSANLVLVIYKFLEKIPEAIPAFFLRIGVALIFFRSGLTKLQENSWQLSDQTIFLFRDEYQMPFPILSAYSATTVELIAPLMLLLGVGSRIAAAAMLAMTFVIQFFVYPENYPDHLLWAGPLLYIILKGPGVLSLDYVVRKAASR